ncbi:MAG: sensor histidine kinase [Limisphaerales bacterium]
MQITKPLNVTDQQLAQLDLHSFLNVLNILMGELQLLKLDLQQPSALPETTQLAGEVLELVRAGRLDAEASSRAVTLQATFIREWVEQLRKAPDAASLPAVREAAENLKSILKVLVVRIEEYQERLRTGNTWRPHSIQELTGNFVNVFAAIEKNSKGRYHIIYNIAAQEATDYLVNFKIESVDGAFINMPPVLQDVFRDLIANARKYTAPGGQISAGLVDNGQELRMVVEDTGCGIPTKEVEQVVDFGYRASNVRDKATRGGGFGLTKAYSTACKLGGTMWITSTLGKGTRVALHIPRPAR